jgi:hypothetical protein
MRSFELIIPAGKHRIAIRNVSVSRRIPEFPFYCYRQSSLLPI